MEQWMFNIFSGTGAFIIGFLVWIGRSVIKNTEGLTHLSADMTLFKGEMREFKKEVREDMKHLETQINRLDTRLDYILILNRRPIDDVSSKHEGS